MISSLLLSLVILVAWTGLISVFNMSLSAQAKTARKVELNTAVDLLTSEIRHAQSVNQSGDVIPNGTTITLADVVTNGGVNLEDLGSYGDIALYLEMPFDSAAPLVCPQNSENAGQAPMGPKTYDPVVYDIRPSPTGWLTPNALVRYGRIPELDGSINPCRNPISRDVVADALADGSDFSLSCNGGIASGGLGFHTCLNNKNIEFIFQSSIAGVDVTPTMTTVTPRTLDFYPDATSSGSLGSINPALSLTSNESAEPGIFQLQWVWSGENSQAINVKSYSLDVAWPSGGLVTSVDSGSRSFNFNARNISLSETDKICFSIKAVIAEGSVITSNQSCS
jgi:hypothetical protein